MNIGIECMDLNPKKRPVARHIIDRLDGTSSSIETSIISSSVEQHVNFLKEQYYLEKTTKLAYNYPRKDKREQAENEELVQYVGEEHWEQEAALGDQGSLWGAQDTKPNFIPEDTIISSSNSGLLYKFSNLDIFNTKARKHYLKNGGPVLEEAKCLKLFKREKIMPILNEHNLIGKDTFGEVYAGVVDRVPVVVRKRIGFISTEERRYFGNEVVMQSQVIHKNILRCIGCCVEVEIPLLVYEYVSKGSLLDILHGNKKVPLDLAMRLSIAAQVADGLAYIHSMASAQILQGDCKPANILFDELFVPKISNFGISSMTSEYSEHIGGNLGDKAYMDPVYLQTGLLTEKSDVYSFGVIILELLTRKKAIHSDNNSLVRNFLENHMQGRKSTELFDKEIAVTGDLELLDILAEIVVECLNLDVDRRPPMTYVAKRLSILNKSHELALLQAS